MKPNPGRPIGRDHKEAVRSMRRSYFNIGPLQSPCGGSKPGRGEVRLGAVENEWSSSFMSSTPR